MHQLKDKISKLISNDSLSENQLLKQLKDVVKEREIGLKPLQKSVAITDLFDKRLTQIIYDKTEENYIKTGFDTIDKEIKGLQKGELVIIGGRPAMGKTQLMISLLLNIAKNHACLFFSFDFDKELLLNRIMFC